MTDADHVVSLDGVAVVTRGRALLEDVTWGLAAGEHAAVLGPNGAGKTTLLRVLSGYRLPSHGTVDVLGARLGAVDVRRLRRRIGIVSDALGPLIDRSARLRDLVAAALHGMTAGGARFDPGDLARADEALERVGIGSLGDRLGTTVSEGEWKRTLLARALVREPALLLLDEPCTGLDLAERERFLTELDQTLSAPGGPTGILVTHHLEEIPRAMTQAVLLRDGRVTATGPITRTLTSQRVTEAFGVAVDVTHTNGRITANATR